MPSKRPPISHKKNKKRMAGPLRVGIALMILGAIIVGMGGLFNRESMSLYGFVVVICGFFLYFASYYYLDRMQKNKSKKIN
ncbi:MAG: hypothetical protein M3Y25_05025 [Thermoproteota archaeon]|jgi:hypothetical protein|nr:hypothetical protein [Thermoproteota archaeon]